MSAYAKPPGYKSYLAVGASGYKPNNNFRSGGMAYGPGRAGHLEVLLSFGIVPQDGSGFDIQDGLPGDPSTPTTSFLYDYSGSPGAGVIPLVAGGGTAAQAAIATQLALSEQLDNWTVEQTDSLEILLTYKHLGTNITSPLVETGETNITFVNFGVQIFGSLLPGRVGGLFCTLPGT